MTNANPLLFMGLAEKLNQKQLTRFLKKSQLELESHYTQLATLLQEKHWQDAKKQAHTIKTTISLFAYADLVTSLDEIEAGHIALIETPAFQATLKQQYQLCLDSLAAALSKRMANTLV